MTAQGRDPQPASARVPLPIVVLISGRGSNMRAIAERARDGRLPVEVRAVISDKPQAPGLTIAQSFGITTHTLAPSAYVDRAAYDRALAELVASYEPALVVLAGFMRILSAEFVERFAGRIMNIHPSLLPKYRGLHTHQRVLEAGDREHGASVHFVTQELDGGPVIIQALIDVKPNDTVDSLSARVQRQEHIIYPQAIEWFAQGRLAMEGERVYLDGKPLARPVVIDAREH
ncbi:MAG: phosphoribosylglycinamide formyltransferase [Gammaproteobacteria bacterium]|nr:phosphoribosylglycinamide formyltransferase [Gammaproteobacteria bacterium]